MIPTGWYSISLATGVILGAVLAFTGRDRRLRWPAGAMILSLVAARAATAFPGSAMPILFFATPVCAVLSARFAAKVRPSAVIAVLYVPRLLCYAAFAFSLLDLAMMWEFSNAFLVLQIAALFAGVIGSGHVVIDRLSMGAAFLDRGGVRLRRAAEARDRALRDTGGDL